MGTCTFNLKFESTGMSVLGLYVYRTPGEREKISNNGYTDWLTEPSVVKTVNVSELVSCSWHAVAEFFAIAVSLISLIYCITLYFETVLSLLLYFLTRSSSHSAHPTFKLILDHAHLWFTEPSSHYFGPFLDFLFSTIFILTAGENPKAGSHRHRAPSPTPGRYQPRWS